MPPPPALGGREGTIIVLDAQTGRVRALVNPKAAYAQAQMPGSAMKPFTALTALRLGLIDEGSRSVCPGRFTGLSFSLPCTHADHLPPFSPAQAIAYSCNYYFATLGQRLGRENLIATAREFGFGQPTGFSAGDEVAGLARPCETGSNTRVRVSESNHVSEQADCEAREAIGESELIQVTPIQLLTAYAALVNGGHLFRPEAGSCRQLSFSRTCATGNCGAASRGDRRRNDRALCVTGRRAPPNSIRCRSQFWGKRAPRPRRKAFAPMAGS
jgi:cell division protein FtsI/penicillin-binding protein 2